MNAKELIQLNNDKRKKLTKENLKYYEDMLLYIRLSYVKSEQETEEILSELLDHLLEAQKEGRSAEEVFGDEPKKYADEIIGELPNLVTKERLKYFAMAALYFFAGVAVFSSLSMVVGHYIFSIQPLTKEIFLGSFLFKTLMSVPIAFLLLYVIIEYFRWSCFKNINKVVEFLLYWLYGIVSIGVFMGLIYITPDFGPMFNIPFYVVLLLGVMLYFSGRLLGKTIR